MVLNSDEDDSFGIHAYDDVLEWFLEEDIDDMVMRLIERSRKVGKRMPDHGYF
jgi:hypothetical protein